MLIPLTLQKRRKRKLGVALKFEHNLYSFYSEIWIFNSLEMPSHSEGEQRSKHWKEWIPCWWFLQPAVHFWKRSLRWIIYATYWFTFLKRPGLKEAGGFHTVQAQLPQRRFQQSGCLAVLALRCEGSLTANIPQCKHICIKIMNALDTM